MPALRKSRSRKAAPRRRVLPKNVRTALRWAMPGLAAATLATGGLWLYASGAGARLVGDTRDALLSASAGMGLHIENVLVTGRNRVHRADVAAALRAERGMAIFAFDPYAAKRRLEALPWVRAATVERRLPDTIYLRLVEREPFALWQKSGTLALIDRDGVVITQDHLGRYGRLPMVVGEDAAAHAEAIVGIVRGRPVVNEVTSAIVRISDRRWNLELKNGVIAELPEDGAARAVAQLADLIAREHILERAIVAIDLRVPDRLVVRMAPGAKPQPGADAGARSKARRAKDT